MLLPTARFDSTGRSKEVVYLGVKVGAKGANGYDAYQISVTLRDKAGKAVSTFDAVVAASSTAYWDVDNADVRMDGEYMTGDLFIAKDDVTITGMSLPNVLDSTGVNGVKSEWDKDLATLTLRFDSEMNWDTITKGMFTLKVSDNAGTNLTAKTFADVQIDEVAKTVKLVLTKADIVTPTTNANTTAEITIAAGIKGENKLALASTTVTVTTGKDGTATDDIGKIVVA